MQDRIVGEAVCFFHGKSVNHLDRDDLIGRWIAAEFDRHGVE